MELSRATVIAMARADAQDRAEEKARREAEEACREEIVARAQAYWHEHGEWEWETRERELVARSGAEARADEQRRAELVERQQVRYAQLVAAGHRPQTVGEILAEAALYP
jgi:hypothetical protein